MQDPQDTISLLQKLIQQTATHEEREHVLNLLAAENPDPEMVSWLNTHFNDPADQRLISAETKASLEDRLGIILAQKSIPTVHRVHFLKTAWFRYAAVLLLIAGTTTFLYRILDKPQQETAGKQPTEKPDILPGSNKAVLTLASGEKIQLDSSANSLLTARGISNNNASLRYTNPPPIATLNTLATPKGGQYKLQLNDGTVVWLNAASSITYPTVFTGKEREVSITGEAYFEVAKHTTKPFVVKTATNDIQVLGTSFNVNAYADEPGMKTSLLEGSVKIGSILLKPGQAFVNGQAVATNLEQDLAWKSGFFNFRNKALPEVMRQIARWYDLEVVYPIRIPNITLVGEISRSMQLPNMLKALEQLEVRYTIEGRTITILP